MAAGQEIDARFISFAPSFRGFGKKVDETVTSEAKRAGGLFGKAFSRGAESSAKSIEDLQRRQSQAVQKATVDIRKARLDQTAAARKVAIEEKKLEELRAGGKAKASQLLQAEDRLANAKRKSAEASGTLAAATTKSSQLLERQRTELDRAKSGADQAGKSFQGLGSKIKVSADQAGRPGVFRKFTAEASRAGVRAGAGLGRGIGRGVSAGVKRAGGVMKKGFLAAAATATAALAVTLQKGFSRLSNIEQATAKLDGLGHSAKTVDGIMKNALASVKGTAFGLDEAATTAAGSVAAGIKPGKELERTLRTVADAATIGGTSLSEMGAIFNKVASSNKIQGDVINQLNDKGIPIVQLLAKELGVTAGEVTQLAAKGKIDFATFRRAMEAGVGGAALKSGNTTVGAFKNMNAALGRVGAALLKGLFPSLGKGFNKVTGWLDGLTPVAERFGARLSSGLDRAGKVAGPFFDKVGKGVKSLRDLLGSGKTKTFAKAFGLEEDSPAIGFMLALRDGAQQAGPVLKGVIVPALKQVGGVVKTYLGEQAGTARALFGMIRDAGPQIQAFATSAGPALVGVFSGLKAILVPVLGIARQVITTVVGALLENLPKITPIISDIGGAFRSVGQLIVAVWKIIGPIVLPILRSLIGTIISVIGGLVKVVRGVLDVLVGVFTGDFSKIKEGGARIFEGLKQIFFGLLNGMMAQTRVFAGFIVKFWSSIWSKVTGTFSRFSTWLGGKLSGLITTLRSAFSLMKVNAIAQVVGLVSGIRSRFASVTSAIMSPIRAARDGVKLVLDGLATNIGKGAAAAGRAFDSIKEAAKKPIRFVVETVINDGLLGAFRSIASKVGLKDLAESMKVSLPKGFERGGWTGNVGRKVAAGVVHGREFVMDALTTAKAGGARAMEAIRGAIRNGWQPAGYERGGYVQPVPGRGNRHTSGYPWATWAGDFPNPIGTPVKSWKDGMVAVVRRLTTSYGNHIKINHTDGSGSLYAHLSKILVAVGDKVSAGQKIGEVGSTGNSTGPHLHFETTKGAFAQGALGSDNSSGFDPLGALKAAFAGPLKQASEIGGGLVGKIAGAIPGKVADTLLEKAKTFPSELAGKVKGAAGTLRWQAVAADALIRTGQLPSPGNLGSLLRRMNQESGGNPRAINNWDSNAKNGTPSKGLMQVIDPTFAAFRDPKLGNDIWDPLQNIVASIRYAVKTYGNLRSAYDRKGGYANGTRSARRGLSWVGERGPELVNFSGGQQVYTNRQSMQISGLAEMMQGSGREVVAGMILGLGSNPAKVEAASAALAVRVTDAAKAELGIASPSKVFVQVGRWVKEGLAKGLTGSPAQVVSAMKTLRTNMEKVWSDRNRTSKASAVSYWSDQVKRLRPLTQERAKILRQITATEKKLATARSAKKPNKQRISQLTAELAGLRSAASGKSYTSVLKNAEKMLAAARKGDSYAGVSAQWEKFAKRNKKVTDAIARNAADRVKIADKLKGAQAKLADAIKVRDEFRAGIRNQAVESASVIGQGTYAPDIIGNLRTRLASWKKFGENLTKLRKLGLGDQAYSEIVAAGPDEGGKAAEALLAGGSGSIRQVNELQKQIRGIGDQVGKQAAGVLYQPGVDAAQGFVDALTSKQKDIERVGEKLAQSLVKSVKKELGIKSPSKVLFAQGEFTGEGYIDGVDAKVAQVEKAGARMAHAVIPGMRTPAPATADTSTELLEGRVEIAPDGTAWFRGIVRQEIKKNTRETAGSRSGS